MCCRCGDLARWDQYHTTTGHRDRLQAPVREALNGALPRPVGTLRVMTTVATVPETRRHLMSAPELIARLGDPSLRVVDARFDLMAPDAGREQYRGGHVPGAVHLDLDRDLSSPPGRGGCCATQGTNESGSSTVGWRRTSTPAAI